jgi:hypothetical protein
LCSFNPLYGELGFAGPPWALNQEHNLFFYPQLKTTL